MDIDRRRRIVEQSAQRLRAAMGEYTAGKITPYLAKVASAVGASIELESAENLKVTYPSSAAASGYLLEHVLVEFGGRNLTEPAKKFWIEPDMAALYDTISFVSAEPTVLDLRRTFWEKVTAIHTFDESFDPKHREPPCPSLV